jgi:predicted nucleic acid-binding protein
MAFYVDTSAILKLVVRESGTVELRTWAEGRTIIASDLVRAEALRAARRHSPEALAQLRTVLTAIPTMAITTSVCDRAAELDPTILRTLDAMHLACALQLSDELEGVVTYDQRMADACVALGLPVVSPGWASRP